MKHKMAIFMVAFLMSVLSAAGAGYGQSGRLTARDYYLYRSRSRYTASPVYMQPQVSIRTRFGPSRLYDCGPGRYGYHGHGRRSYVDRRVVYYSYSNPRGHSVTYSHNR